MEKYHDSEINLSEEMRAELNCWIQNIYLNKGKTLFSNPSHLMITSDESLKCTQCLLSRTQIGGSVDLIRTEKTYKYFTVDCSKICNSSIHSIESFSKINQCANGQRSCTVVYKLSMLLALTSAARGSENSLQI